MKKYICTLLLTLCYCFSSYGQSVGSGYIMIDGLYYYYTDNGGEIWSTFFVSLLPLPDNEYYKGDIYIPDYVIINGVERKVNGITDGVFYNCTELTSVSFPAERMYGRFDKRFNNNPNLEAIYLRGRAKNGEDATCLNGVNIWRTKLFVAEEDLDYYHSTFPYFYFHNIETFDLETEVRKHAETRKVGKTKYYNLNGQEIPAPNEGITIVAPIDGTAYKVKK